jgi:3-oxoadipate enol-lactonase
MDHLEITRAHFLGLSMGGMVGQHLGLDHPQRFASLILCSTTSRMPPEARPLWDERAKVARDKGMASQVELALSRWLAAATAKNKPALVARLKRYIETTPAEGYAGWCLAIRDLDVTNRLKAIKLPTRVIVGSEDPSTPPAAAQVIHREIAGSELVEVPGVSHQLHVEEPETFNRHVLEFLDRQPR